MTEQREDPSHAFQKIPLDEESKKCVVINTHRGLFRCTRLPFRMSSAPGSFQHVIKTLFQGIERVAVYLDAEYDVECEAIMNVLKKLN